MAVIHPYGRTLGNKYPGLTAQLFLNIPGGQVDNLVAGISDLGILAAAFAGAMQPNNQRNLAGNIFRSKIGIF